MKEEVPTNSAASGSSVAGLDNNPPGKLAAEKKKRNLETFNQFLRR